MRANHRAIESYGQVKVTTGVSQANSVELIQMLFDGLLESMSAAKGHIQHHNIAEKSKAIARASRIVLGLQGALDFEKGGDLAKNLNGVCAIVGDARQDSADLLVSHQSLPSLASRMRTAPSRQKLPISLLSTLI